MERINRGITREQFETLKAMTTDVERNNELRENILDDVILCGYGFYGVCGEPFEDDLGNYLIPIYVGK